MNQTLKNILMGVIVFLVALALTAGVALAVGAESVVDEILIGQLAGASLSILMFILPGVKTWFDSLDDSTMQMVNVGVLFLVALVLFGLGCLGLLQNVQCTKEGALSMFVVFVNLLIGNSGAYTATKKVLKKPKIV